MNTELARQLHTQGKTNVEIGKELGLSPRYVAILLDDAKLAQHRVKARQQAQERRKADPARNRAVVSTWQRKNPDKANAKAAKHYERHRKEKTLKSRIQYRKTVQSIRPIRDVNLGGNRRKR